jgi:hypothetical protein
VNRQTLGELLDQENVDSSAYDLEGRAIDDRYVLERSNNTWTVFFSERGLRTGEQRFDSEDAACRHLFALVLRDSTTRRR